MQPRVSDWKADVAASMETGTEPWWALIRLIFHGHTIWIEAEREDGKWTVSIAEAREEGRGN